MEQYKDGDNVALSGCVARCQQKSILFFGQTYSDAGNNVNFAFKRCLSITIKQRNSLVYIGLYW